jgi:hypothetical protein
MQILPRTIFNHINSEKKNVKILMKQNHEYMYSETNAKRLTVKKKL